MTPASDHDLGLRIGGLIAEQGGADYAAAPLIGQVQDLLGQDTTLLGPLRDLLQRPAFRRLFAEGQRSVQIGGRDALVQDLATLYHPAVVARLSAVMDGCLGLRPGPNPAPPSSPPPEPQPQPGPPPPPWTPPPPPQGTSPSAAGYPSQPYASPYPPQSYPAPVPAAAGATGPVTILLSVVASLLAAAVLLGLGWLILQNRPTSAPKATASGSTPTRPATPQPPTPPPVAAAPGTDKAISEQAAPEGAWGDASAYKFGQLPGGDYPTAAPSPRPTPAAR